MLCDFEDDPSLIGADRLRILTRLKSKYLVLQLLRKRTPLEVLQVTALRRSWTGGIGFRQFVEFRALLQLRVNSVALGLTLRNQLVSVRLRLSGFGRRWLRRNQNFAQSHRLWT